MIRLRYIPEDPGQNIDKFDKQANNLTVFTSFYSSNPSKRAVHKGYHFMLFLNGEIRVVIHCAK